jgi:hypothetical protein
VFVVVEEFYRATISMAFRFGQTPQNFQGGTMTLEKRLVAATVDWVLLKSFSPRQESL